MLYAALGLYQNYAFIVQAALHLQIVCVFIGLQQTENILNKHYRDYIEIGFSRVFLRNSIKIAPLFIFETCMTNAFVWEELLC